MNFPERFSQWASGFSGCDGGDLGSPASPSIWVCGIEWGGDFSYKWLEEELDTYYNQSSPGKGYDSPQDNLAYPYNINTMKLLCAINGMECSEYKNFALEQKPFVSGSSGYFKMNLYPIRFKGASPDKWSIWINSLTGFSNKKEYQDWCRKNRFVLFRELVKKHEPKLILCFGKTYLTDFKAAFCHGDEKWHHETIENRSLSFARNKNTLIAVCPFPTSRYGLNSNSLLRSFGRRISEEMRSTHGLTCAY